MNCLVGMDPSITLVYSMLKFLSLYGYFGVSPYKWKVKKVTQGPHEMNMV